MGIQLFWDDEAQSVLLMEIKGAWTWQELTDAMQTIERISQERQQTFNAILDLSWGLKFPDGGIFSQSGLNQFRKLTKFDGKKRGKMVILGVNPFIQRIIETASQIDPNSTRNLFFANTLNEAQRIVYE